MLDKLVPGFLKKADHYLLTRYPVLWKSKIHYVAFYSLILGNLGAYGLASAYPMSITNIPGTATVYTLFTIACILCGFAGLWYAFEQRKFPLQAVSPIRKVLFIPLIILCLSSFVINAGLFQSTLVSKIATMVDDQEYQQDEPILEQIRTYTFEVDNYTQYNLNNKYLREMSAKYGYPQIQYSYDRYNPKQNMDLINELSNKMHSLNSAKYYVKHFDGSNFLGDSSYASDCYYNPTAIYSSHLKGFWRFSIFFIALGSTLIFLLAQTSSLMVVKLVFGGFLSLVTFMFIGSRVGLSFESTCYITLPIITVLPFFLKRKTTINALVTGIATLLLPTISIGFAMLEFDALNNGLLLLVLILIMALCTTFTYFNLFKDRLPETV